MSRTPRLTDSRLLFDPADSRSRRAFRRAGLPRSVLTLLLVAGAVEAANEFTPLPTLGGDFGGANDVSADGRVVVGFSTLPGDLVSHAYRWTSAGIDDLGTLGGDESFAVGVSGDGAVVVGNSEVTPGNPLTHAFRWTGAGGIVDLGTLGGSESFASDASHDGSVVVGESDLSGDATFHGYRWTAGAGMVDLGTLGGGASHAAGVSANGEVVAGDSLLVGNTAFHAYRWTSAGGMVDLGTLGGNDSYSLGISADGSTVVGDSQTAGPGQPLHGFRWTGATGMVDLGTLGGTTSSAIAVSADGSVVVGSSKVAGDSADRAFRWTQSTNMQSIVDWLAAAGVSVPAGWELTRANGISADGSVIVGFGNDPANAFSSWLARVDPAAPGPGLITNLGAFTASVVEAGSAAARVGVGLPNLTLTGTHHRSLMDSGLVRRSGGNCAWATADIAGENRSDGKMELAEFGVCHDFAANRIGIGLGQAWAQQDWGNEGGAHYDGQYVLSEIDHAFANGLQASLLGYYGRFDTRLNRHYRNGAAVDGSKADPDARSVAARARVDWKELAELASFRLSPYAAYSWIETRVDGYTETGGAFPASYEETTWKTEDLRLGIAGRRPVSPVADMTLTLEGVHRTDDAVDDVKGEVLGLFRFNVPGESYEQNWARAIIDVDHRISDRSLATFSLNGATSGDDSVWGLSAGIRHAF